MLLFSSLCLLITILLSYLLIFPISNEETEHYYVSTYTQASYDELLSAPFLSDGTWVFIDDWTIINYGKYSDPILAEEGLHEYLSASIQSVLSGHVLYALTTDEDCSDYDAFVKNLLDINNNPILYIRLGVGSDLSVSVHNDSIIPTQVQIISLDGKRVYLTIGYKTIPAICANKYVFYSDDPVLLRDLFEFADNFFQMYPQHEILYNNEDL